MTLISRVQLLGQLGGLYFAEEKQHSAIRLRPPGALMAGVWQSGLGWRRMANGTCCITGTAGLIQTPGRGSYGK